MTEKIGTLFFFTECVHKLIGTVTYVKMASHIALWIIPGLIGAATNNAYNLTLISVFNYMFYVFLKYAIYPFLWCRVVVPCNKFVERSLKKDRAIHRALRPSPS